jgi:hypothetical protein
MSGFTSWLVVAAVVVIVAVTVPEVESVVSETGEPESAQVGESVGFETLDEVSEQLSVAVPT